LGIQVFFVIAHLEEVAVLSSSEWVVPVRSDQFSLSSWGFDIPEDMVWNGRKDSLFSSLAKTFLVGVLKISDIVIFIFEEGSKLLV